MDEKQNQGLTPPEPPKKARLPLWARVVMAVSIGLNLLVIGIVAGLALTVGPSSKDRPPMRSSGLMPFVAALPPEVRPDVVERLREANGRPGERSGRMHRGHNLAVLADLVRADPFDPDALLAYLSDAQMRQASFAERSHGILVSEISALSASERLLYADRLERFGKFRDGKGDKRPSPGS